MQVIEPYEGMREEMEAMCNLSEGIWERGIREGLEQGIEQGMERGRMEGEEIKLRKVVVNLLKDGMSDEKICMIAECNMDYLSDVKNSHCNLDEI